MSVPSDKTERLCAMFDSYCKTVLRNESRDIKRTLVRRSKRELAMDEPMQYIFNLISHEDTYPSEQLTLYADRVFLRGIQRIFIRSNVIFAGTAAIGSHPWFLVPLDG